MRNVCILQRISDVHVCERVKENSISDIYSLNILFITIYLFLYVYFHTRNAFYVDISSNKL